MLGRIAVLLRLEAGDRLLEARELDDDVAVKVERPFHDLKAAPARENLRAVLLEDVGERVRIFLVFDRIVDLRVSNPIGRHGRDYRWWFGVRGSRFAVRNKIPGHDGLTVPRGCAALLRRCMSGRAGTRRETGDRVA